MPKKRDLSELERNLIADISQVLRETGTWKEHIESIAMNYADDLEIDPLDLATGIIDEITLFLSEEMLQKALAGLLQDIEDGLGEE